jgi:hypothetical protein
MTAEQAVEKYARDRMARGELLTWKYNAKHRRVTLYVPLDVEVKTFPRRIAGVPTTIKRMPRPVPFATVS